ncbi:MAG: double zinc ribbon domain-containing protein, partial [Patescibacteria group bacterium]
MGILDYIFPKRCINCKKQGDYLCPNCFTFLSFDTKNICLVCKKQSLTNFTHKYCRKKYKIDGCFSGIRNNYIAKKLISSFKNKPYLTDLQSFLIDLLYESLIQSESFMKLIKKTNFVLVPVPLSGEMLRKRGYNQAEILSKGLGKKLNIKILNLEKVNIETKNVFIVDDLINTGKTLENLAFVLKKKGV